jgi:hypothetical protein
MTDSPISGYWAEGRVADGGCSFRWAENAPRCGAPVTLHVLTESAIYGKGSVGTCEPHASIARAVGVYLGEHSPSFPDCRCTPVHDQERPQLAADPDDVHRDPLDGVPDYVKDRLRYSDRVPFDLVFARRALSQVRAAPDPSTVSIHYRVPRDGVEGPLCGAPGSGVLAGHWRAVSCPACRTTGLDPSMAYGRIVPGSELDVPRLPGTVFAVEVRPPYDPELDRRLRAVRLAVPYARDGLTHYPDTHDGWDIRPLCGAGKYLMDLRAASEYVTSRNWRLVSCPTCRTTETPR